MAIKNLDKKNEILSKLSAAMKANDETAMNAAMAEFTSLIQETVLDEARGMISAADQTVLAGRGVRALTSMETKFYNSFISAARSDAPKAAIANIDTAWPQTVVDTVIDDVQAEHPLLDAIDFRNTGVLTKWFVNHIGNQNAVWGAITSAITGQMEGAIEAIDLTQNKLTAFMTVSNDLLDAGPQWVDRYVRAILTDALALGVETAVVAGTGLNQPIGMIKDLDSALDTSTGKSDKDAVVITDLSMATIGTLKSKLAKLTFTNGSTTTTKYRPVTGLVMVVNPEDLYEKVEPAYQLLTPNGYLDITKGEIQYIASPAVTKGTAAFGMAKEYFMGIGTAKSGVLEYDDSVKFDDDERFYRIKFRGNGRAKTNFDFLKLSFTNLKEAAVPTRSVS